MSQRDSGYERQLHDRYTTPSWVSAALVPHLPSRIRRVWEPAAGGGEMVSALRDMTYEVVGTDIADGVDFLSLPKGFRKPKFDAIITNPPFDQSQAFIETGLELAEPRAATVAMLFRSDYDSAKTRQHLFGRCSPFAMKVVLLRRIVWFARPGAAPSVNHAWFVWDWMHSGPPTIAYSE